MQTRRTHALATTAAATLLLLAGCGGGDDGYSASGAQVEVGGATFVSPAASDDGGTDGEVVSVEELVGAEPDALRLSATVGDGPEFPRYLGLWEIDIDGAEVRFEPTASEPWEGAWTVHRDGETMRVTIEGLTGLASVESDDSTVDAGLADGALVVIMGPGFDTSTGFTITLD